MPDIISGMRICVNFDEESRRVNFWIAKCAYGV